MRETGWALALSFLLTWAAAAYPYDVQYGCAIAHAPPGVTYTVDLDACDTYAAAPIADCSQQVNRIDIANQPMVWYVLLAWGDGTETKYWRGFEFGLGDFVAGTSGYMITQHGYCPVPEPGTVLTIATEGWPGPNEGIAMSATTTEEAEVWSGNLKAMYWFAGYAYSAQVVPLGPNPSTGTVSLLPLPGHSQPVQVDLFLGAPGVLGSMGLLTDGVAASPPVEITGACCFFGNECQVLTLAECDAQGATFQAFATTCDPNPCPTVWGCCIAGADPSPYCFMLTEESCETYGGIWHETGVCPEFGGDLACDDCCLHVCCVDGVCHEFNQRHDCVNMGGIWHPEVGGCSPPNPCHPEPVGRGNWGAIKAIYR